MTSTYFVVYTVDTDDAADAIAIARHMDEPTEAPTIAELRARIMAELLALADDIENPPRPTGDADEDSGYPLIEASANRIVEIVTLGNVPAGGES